MDDPAKRWLEELDLTPANDAAAHVLRWIGLVGGISLCAVGIASVFV